MNKTGIEFLLFFWVSPRVIIFIEFSQSILELYSDVINFRAVDFFSRCNAGITRIFHPKREWVDCIIEQCSDAGAPVFIKDNAQYPIVRREFPRGLKG